MDYGLDMLAVLWFARDTEGNAYAYKELHESNLIISEACKRFKEVNNSEKYEYIYAPRDLWNRRQETGKSVADIFYENGVRLTQTSVDRVDGWLATKEWMKVIKTRNIETGEEIQTSKMKIFRNCKNLIENLPQIQTDEKDPNDCATEPHDITHICDSMRYFCVNFTRPAGVPQKDPIFNFDFEKPHKDPVGKGDKITVI
jgi:phage terminase large subunit